MGNKRRRSSSSSSESSASSSDEDERIQTKNKQVDSTSSSESDDEEWNERAKKKQTKPINKSRNTGKQPPKKQVKEIKESEDEREEGEVEDDDDEFNDGYDDNLMGDEEDKKRLLQMTEKEREQELFNRSEKREVLKTRFEIEKKLRLAKKKEQNKIPFTDVNLRSTDRRKALENNRKQKDGLQQLKEQREKRRQKAKLRASDVYSSSDDDSDERNNRRKSSSSSSESSSDESSGDERRRRGSDDERSQIEEVPFELEHKTMNSIRLSRFKMSQWCHTPFFKETVIGCFVRLSVGIKDGKQMYRIAEITDVSQGPVAYDLEATKTDKLVKCKHGRDERNFRIQYVSNTEFSENEFNEWKSRMERDRISLPNRKQIDEKLKHIQAALNYNFKESDIEAIVKEKEKYAQIPVNFAVRKTELKKMKDLAEQNGDLFKVNELTEQLDDLEQKAKELDYKRTQSISAISYINERNRMRNIVESEKAIVAAREEERLNQGDDPFKRRKCAPMLVSIKKVKGEVEKPVESKDEVDRGLVKDSKFTFPNANGSTQKSSSNNSTNSLSTIGAESKSTNSATGAESEQNDLFSAHDFDIQIDFDITNNLTSTSNNSISNSLYASNLSCSSIASNKSTNRRSLNLEEYKKKKGLI